jgi:hypothetical protein
MGRQKADPVVRAFEKLVALNGLERLQRLQLEAMLRGFRAAQDSRQTARRPIDEGMPGVGARRVRKPKPVEETPAS